MKILQWSELGILHAYVDPTDIDWMNVATTTVYGSFTSELNLQLTGFQLASDW